jgi:hypothetical protein
MSTAHHVVGERFAEDDEYVSFTYCTYSDTPVAIVLACDVSAKCRRTWSSYISDFHIFAHFTSHRVLNACMPSTDVVISKCRTRPEKPSHYIEALLSHHEGWLYSLCASIYLEDSNTTTCCQWLFRFRPATQQTTASSQIQSRVHKEIKSSSSSSSCS